MHARARIEHGRGWGPFSGRQLATIICVLGVAVLFPFGAWAVTGSNVFVTDSGTGAHAAVSSSGALTVAEASPLNFFNRSANLSTSGFKKIIAAPSGKALVVTSVDVDVFVASFTGIGHNVEVAVSKTNNTCSATVGDPLSLLPAIDINPPSVGMTVVPLQPGLVVPANRALCAEAPDAPNVEAEVFAFGYLVPANAAPTGAASTAGSPLRVQH